MVRAVRKGASMREVAARFGVSVGTVVHWVSQAHGKRLDRVSFTNCKPGRAWNRTPEEVEQRILSARTSLREESILGEYGPDAIGLALRQDEALAQVPGAHDDLPRARALTGCSMAPIGNAGRPRPRAGICPIWPPAVPSSIASISSRT